MWRMSRYAGSFVARLISMFGLVLVLTIVAGEPGSAMALAEERAVTRDDPDIVRLAEQARAAFLSRMEPPIIELTLGDITARDATGIVRDYVREQHDAAVAALVDQGRTPAQVRRVKAALRQLVDIGDAELADVLLAEVAEQQGAEGEAAAREAAAYLRHSVSLDALPAAMRSVIKRPSESTTLAPRGEKAAAAYARAAELDPSDPWTWIVLAGLTTTPTDFNQAIQRARDAAQASKDKRAMIVALQVSGLVYGAIGNAVESERRYHLAASLARQWTREEPDNTTAQRYLALTLNRIGDSRTAERRFADAAAAYGDSLSIRERLARVEPDNQLRRIDLIAGNMNLFALATAEGDEARARRHSTVAWEIYNALAAQEPFRASLNVYQPGAIITVLVAAGLLTLIVAVIVLARYRRVIRRYMLAAATTGVGRSAAEFVSVPPPAAAPAGLPLRTIDVRTRSKGASSFRSTALAGAARAARRAAWTYAIAGLTFATASAAIWLTVGGIEITWPRMTSVVLSWVWPVAFSLALVWGPDRRRLALLLAAYLAVLLALCTRMAFSATQPLPVYGVTVPAVLQPVFALVTQAAPSLFLLLFLNRRIRAVGPIVIVLMIVACVGTLAALLGASTYAGLRAVAWFGLPTGVAFWGLHLVGMLLFLPLGWLAIAWMRRRYDRKRFSEQTLVHDSLWLFQTGQLCLDAIQNIGVRGWLAFAVFPLYKGIVWLGLRPLTAAAASRPPARLLLLRTFGFRRRAERFFDLLGARWRYAGPIQLIAAPDLAGRSIDPGELLDFLSGRLRHRFIIESADLDRRLAEVDQGPDPDGRFRVNEIFCGNDAWRPAVRRLMADSDIIVMDLRGFSTGNQGCLFELQSLIDIVPVAHVVLLTDTSTDAAFLQQTLIQCWQAMAPSSPNREAAGTLTHLETAGRDVAAVDMLLRIADRVLASFPEGDGGPATAPAVQPTRSAEGVPTGA